MANHVFDETKGFDPNMVKDGDIIFLKADLIETFFKYFHQQIKNRYVLLSHNSDFSLDFVYQKYLDDKIIHWFAQNINFEADENFSLLPIGLENRRYFKSGLIYDFNKYKNSEKKHLVLLSFNEKTNISRLKVKEVLKNNKLITSKMFKNSDSYKKTLSESMFNICPPGNGLDTHRFWESLLLNALPIVVRSNFTSNLEKLDIPALYLDKWTDLNEYKETELKSIYMEKLSKNDLTYYVQFKNWKELIFNSKSSIVT
tara:strand:+ start:26046 stop:26816 length:771 start_codon:yes stop_codon:yes gene_type:complete